MFSKETLVKRNLKTSLPGSLPTITTFSSLQLSHHQLGWLIAATGWGRDTGQTGLLPQLLTLSRTTLVGHLSISVNGFESDFLAASFSVASPTMILPPCLLVFSTDSSVLRPCSCFPRPWPSRKPYFCMILCATVPLRRGKGDRSLYLGHQLQHRLDFTSQ